MEAFMLHRSRLSLIAAMLLTGPFTVSPAVSQDTTGLPCADRDVIVEFLRSHYGEHLKERGLASSGYVVELYTSPTTTWTIVATPPAGQSCVVAQGVAWDIAGPREQSVRR
jgi:hypothetical protein